MNERGSQTALTWVPEELLGADPAHGLVQLACDMCVDLAFVPTGRSWTVQAKDQLRLSGIEPLLAFDGPWTVAAGEQGWGRLIAASASPGERSSAVLRDALSRSLEVIVPMLIAGSQHGTVVIADDLAADNGWIVDPRAVRDLYLPTLAEVVRIAKGNGASVIFHSDGDVSELFESLFGIGVDGVHISAESNLQHIANRASEAGLAAWGGISIRSLERLGATRMAQQVLRECGGIAVICDDGGVSEAGQLESLIATHRHLR